MRGLLLLLCALLLLESTEGNNPYDQLSDHHKEIVNKAIERANTDFAKHHHLDFFSIIKANDEKRMLHVLLKPTSCKKEQSFDRGDCVIQAKAKPQVSCVDCDGSMSCFRLMDHVKIKEAERKCLHVHHHGGAVLFSRTGEDEQITGCLGCF